jgi:hypothetical protein
MSQPLHDRQQYLRVCHPYPQFIVEYHPLLLNSRLVEHQQTLHVVLLPYRLYPHPIAVPTQQRTMMSMTLSSTLDLHPSPRPQLLGQFHLLHHLHYRTVLLHPCRHLFLRLYLTKELSPRRRRMIYTRHLRPGNRMIGRHPHRLRLHHTNMLHHLCLSNKRRLFHLKREQLHLRLHKSSIPHRYRLWTHNLECCQTGSRLMQVI